MNAEGGRKPDRALPISSLKPRKPTLALLSLPVIVACLCLFAVSPTMASIIASTLVSEDLTSIAVGVMVAQGRIGYLFGATACFLGIFIGDMLLFLSGRYLGRPALQRAPLRWLIKPGDVEKSSAWFSRKGLIVILTSRFVPGARLPTYFAAGMLNTSFGGFTLYFLAAGVVWTPLLVGLTALLGEEALKSALFGSESVLVKLLGLVAVTFLTLKLVMRLTSHRGRRLLVSWWRRKTRWEFWPPWAFYPPVFCYVLWLAIKHRSLTLFTAANPAIPGGGFIGESKTAILEGLAGAGDYIARAARINPSASIETRVEEAKAFMAANGIGYPVVLKPDVGQRGTGVAIVSSEGEMAGYFRRAEGLTIIQEHIPGQEFGVFYYRRPGEDKGRIFSITEKQFPAVTGDGASTLERLILSDERAVCMARLYCDKQSARLMDVLAPGERVQLIELGSHCRGALFLDGGWARTPALEQAIDYVSKSFDGFYFGRFDIRAPSIEAFITGQRFKVIELNGVTSEATHIYDPKNSLFAAYKTLFEQWRVAFEIGAQNRARGIEPASLSSLIRPLLSSRTS